MNIVAAMSIVLFAALSTALPPACLGETEAGDPGIACPCPGESAGWYLYPDSALAAPDFLSRAQVDVNLELYAAFASHLEKLLGGTYAEYRHIRLVALPGDARPVIEIGHPLRLRVGQSALDILGVIDVFINEEQ